MSDRRAGPRQTVNLELNADGGALPDYLSDLSRTGVFIRSEDPLPLGTLINLRFTVNVRGDISVIEGVGEVVRRELEGKTPGMGVAFRELTSPSRAVIDQILSDR